LCNLYSITTNQTAIIALFRVINRYVGNLPPMPSVFPDYLAPVVRNASAEREVIMMRWGMPPPPKIGGPPVTSNTSSPHWWMWLKPENRCSVPANSFAEYALEPNRATCATVSRLDTQKTGSYPRPLEPNAAIGAMMIATVASFVPTTLVAVLTAVFLVAGTINLSGRGTVKADFARWGFPAGFHLVCGGLELVGAAMLLSSSTRFWGLMLLGAIMAGAIFSLLRNREPLSHFAPAFAIAVLLLAAIALSANSFLAALS
jgi:hypothetical protein